MRDLIALRFIRAATTAHTTTRRARLGRAPRRRHRSRWCHDRRAAHVARTRRLRQGAARNTAPGPGPSAGSGAGSARRRMCWRPARGWRRCCPSRRPAGTCRSSLPCPPRTWPRSSCRRGCAGSNRPRQRSGRAPRGGDARRARQRRRHRGPRAHAARNDFNTDLTALGREALAASLRVQLTPEDVARFLIVDRHPGPRPRQRAPGVGSVLAVGRARPSRWRWCRKRLRPATAARGFLPLSPPRRGCAAWAAAIPRETRKPCSPSSAALRPCRLRLWVRASAAPGFEIARRPRMGAASLNEEQTP